MSKPAGSAARPAVASTTTAANTRSRRGNDTIPQRSAQKYVSWPAQAGHPVASDGRVEGPGESAYLCSAVHVSTEWPALRRAMTVFFGSNPHNNHKRRIAVPTVRWCVALGLCTLLASCAKPPPPPPPPPPPAEVWPETSWTFSTPEAQGIDSEALAEAIEAIRNNNIPVHSLFVERNGYAVLDVYFFPFADNETHDLASVTKSVTSTLVGIAQGQHRLARLDQPIVSLLPVNQTAAADPRQQRITLANLLSMTSGLDCRGNPAENVLGEMEQSPHWADFMLARPQAFDPGTTFEYCGGSMHVVSAALSR